LLECGTAGLLQNCELRDAPAPPPLQSAAASAAAAAPATANAAAASEVCDVDAEVPPVVPLTDGGLDFNFPLLPLLRPERQVDVLLVLDYSQYDPKFTKSNEWARVAEYCARNRVPFPRSFDQGTLAAAPLSVFPGDATGAPTLVVLHTNVARASLAAHGAAKTFSPLENAKAGGYCDLSTLKYTAAQFDELFAFGEAHFEGALPQIKAALRDALALKRMLAEE
jgi:hypothetical protein